MREAMRTPDNTPKTTYMAENNMGDGGNLVELYPWQAKIIQEYQGKGVIKAVTGAGKTLVGKKIAEKIGGKILITSHRNVILDQWRIVMEDLPKIEFMTFNEASTKQIKNVRLLIIDEAHRSVSPKFIHLYWNIEYKYILALTATPNEKVIEKCGPLLCDIRYDQAKIAPFQVIFHGIKLTWNEQNEYSRLSYSISKMIRKQEDQPQKYNDNLEAIIMKRRQLVYNAKKRIPYAIKIINNEWCNNKKILVVCQRIDQAEKISRALTEMKPSIPHTIYHSKRMNDLEDYRKGKTQVCISVGMLKEGFNDPDTDCGIIVSTTLSEDFNTQTIGRIIRHKPGKRATIHILLANQTTDTRVLKYSANYDFQLINITIPHHREDAQAYYEGEKYSFCENRIWKKEGVGINTRRIYYQYHPIIDELKKIKREGGSFILSKKGVYTKQDGQIIKVSDEIITLQEKDGI